MAGIALKRLLSVCGLIGALVMGISSALAQAPQEAGRSSAQGGAAGLDPATYRVGAEDLLEISVWREDALKKEALVRSDGGISYPLIGEVQAAGKTVLEIRDDIAKRLEKFIPDPVVSVAVLKSASQRIYVIGKVNKPGEFPVGRQIDVLQALSMAGGLTAFADGNDIRVLRRDGGQQVVLPFEYHRVVKGQKLEQNILLRGGDVVVVP